MFHPEAWRQTGIILAALSILLLTTCGTGSKNPLSCNGTSYQVASLEFLNLPDEEQLAGGNKCKEAMLVPDKSRKVKVHFAKLDFPAGTVIEKALVEVCADKSIYAVLLDPSGFDFLIPVTVEFKLNAKELGNDQLERIRVVWISPDGLTEVIPHTLEVKKKRVTVRFSIDHSSVYALIMV